MIGGFLGAGKTTTIARLARRLVDRGHRVGLVTNDQAYQLVDTQFLRAEGFDVGEVAGACFCCKFNDLVETVGRLAAVERPEFIIAEPVGSCTDLVATVVEPLKHLYGRQYEIAPYVVLLKPEHGRKILSAEAGTGFSPKAAYLFLKQIEEADVVAINKIDKLSDAEQAELIELIQRRFPGKEVLRLSARRGDGFDRLLDVLNRPEPAKRITPEINYDTYAEGEAELGWLNCTIRITSASEQAAADFSLDGLLVDFAEGLREKLHQAGAETAHLKILATEGQDSAIVNLVSSRTPVELSKAAQVSVSRAELTLNARVATDPDQLAGLVRQETTTLARRHKLKATISDEQSFRPSRPVPTHRMRVATRD